MRVLLLAVGTRGDVKPFIALAHGVAAAGHSAVLCTTQEHEELCARLKVSFASVGESITDDPDVFKAVSAAQAEFESGKMNASQFKKKQT